MAKATLKWIKFYPSDWFGDPGLRACSIGARGLWMDMLCLMVNASPYGHLKMGRKKIDAAELAGLVGTPLNRVEKLLAELRQAGVFSLTSHGTIYSRRLVREEKWRRNGKKGSAIRWSQATEKEGETEKRIRGSTTLESKSLRIPSPSSSEQGVARGSASKTVKPKTRDPPDYSNEPVTASEALMRTRLFKH